MGSGPTKLGRSMAKTRKRRACGSNMAVRSAIVTGGAGFVGSALARALIADGFSVTAYDSLRTGREEFLPPGANLIVADIRDEARFRETVELVKPDVVFHTAAIHYIPYCDGHPQETMQVNVEGTEIIVRVSDELKVPRVVFCSTAAVYPAHNEALSESSTSAAPMDIYGYTKWFGEQLIAWKQKKSGTRFVIARLFNVYGPRETSAHLIPAILKQILEGVTKIKVGNIEPKRDYVFVDDVAKSLLKLGVTQFDGPNDQPICTNVCSGIEHSVREVLQDLQTVTDQMLELEQDPARMRASDRPHLLGDPERLKAIVGWGPDTEFHAGLKALVTWAKENPTLMVG